ncbi:MAG: hypothetical protein DVB23_001210 [Verrucomicrobia bacterium]|jgi:hypothetical protein|nr:MAG: hypothetical protein DVB23_001210 [Verrucomicrobiota bacterium]
MFPHLLERAWVPARIDWVVGVSHATLSVAVHSRGKSEVRPPRHIATSSSHLLHHGRSGKAAILEGRAGFLERLGGELTVALVSEIGGRKARAEPKQSGQACT